MRLVALCSPKGGTGKTTLAFNLAERGVASGMRVLVVDFDPQEASMALADTRAGSSVPRELVWEARRLHVGAPAAGHLDELRERGEFDLVICDLPGSENIALGQVLSRMDLVLSPVSGSSLDILAAVDFHYLGQQIDLPVQFVANNMARGVKRLEFIRRELEGRQARVCPVTVYRRVTYPDAHVQGQGVSEYAPRGPAAAEVRELWRWVCGELGLESLQDEE